MPGKSVCLHNHGSAPYAPEQHVRVMLEVGLSPLSTAGLYLSAQQFLFSEKPMLPDEAADDTEDLSTLNSACTSVNYSVFGTYPTLIV